MNYTHANTHTPTPTHTHTLRILQDKGKRPSKSKHAVAQKDQSLGKVKRIIMWPDDTSGRQREVEHGDVQKSSINIYEHTGQTRNEQADTEHNQPIKFSTSVSGISWQQSWLFPLSKGVRSQTAAVLLQSLLCMLYITIEQCSHSFSFARHAQQDLGPDSQNAH